MTKQKAKKAKTATKAKGVHLSEEQLEKVTGGAGYLKISDIKGESTDDGHKDWINIQSISSS